MVMAGFLPALRVNCAQRAVKYLSMTVTASIQKQFTPAMSRYYRFSAVAVSSILSPVVNAFELAS